MKGFLKRNSFFLLSIYISIIISIIFSTYVNNIVYKLLPEIDFEIKADDNLNNGTPIGDYIILLEKGNMVSLAEQYEKYNNSVYIDYVEKDTSGWSNNYISLKDPNRTIKLKLKEAPNTSITFYNAALCSKINVIRGNSNEKIDLNIDNDKIYSYYPFRNSSKQIIYTAVIYILFIIILNFLIFLLYSINQKKQLISQISKNIKRYTFFYKYSPKHMVFIIYFITFIYVTIKYFIIKIPESYYVLDDKNIIIGLNGDQGYYWEIGRLIKELDIESLKGIFSPRGYISSLVPVISLIISSKINIDAYYINHIISIIFSSLLIGYIIPEIHFMLSNKKVKNYQILIMYLIFSFFWKGTYYSITIDIQAITCLLVSFLLFLKKKNFFICGIFLAATSLYRMNYFIGFKLFIALYGIYLYMKHRNDILKSIVLYRFKILIFICGFILTCIPQAYLNYNKGHIGILPYDHKDSYVVGQTLREVMIDATMKGTFTGWPYIVGDELTENMKTNYGIDKDEQATIHQLLSIYLYSPLQSVLVIFRKLFASLDLKTNEVYPPFYYKNHTFFYLFSFLNYFIISTSLYVIKFNKKLNYLIKEEEILFGILLFTSILLPQTIIHVEWRYYILLHFIIYYIFSFKFIDWFTECNNKNNIINIYIIFISLTILFLFNLSGYYFS